MARIRSIKPEFFRHETLQDLEIENPGKYPMLVFAGLWGHCDSRGRFEWRPRQLKLDILPFLQFDMGEVLALLERAGMVKHYSCNGKDYGEIKSFEKHQRLSGKEASCGDKYPSPISEAAGKQRGSNGEIPESQEEEEEGKRKGRGREEEGKRNGVDAPPVGDAAGASPSAKVIDLQDKTETELQAVCRVIWKSYSLAYFERYSTEPVINAKVRSQVKQFAQRIPMSEAPEVASFYVRHCDAFYVRKGHDFGQLLSDAEKLRTEWATGRQITGTQARQTERVSAMYQAVAEIEAEQARSQA